MRANDEPAPGEQPELGWLTCPLCGGRLNPVTLEHVTRSGARIPAGTP